MIGTIVLAVPTLASTPKPTVSSFKAVPSALGWKGGAVTLTALVAHATSCTFSVTPPVKGLPATVSCVSNKVTKKVTLPKNISAVAKSYTFSFKATGPGGSTRAKPLTRKVLAAPSISSFAAGPKTLAPEGGAVTLTALVAHATRCTFSVTPPVKGLPETVSCVSVAVKKVSLSENATASTMTYTFFLKASGPGGSTTAKPQNAAVLPFWSASQAIDPVGGGLTSVSCSTSSFCYSVDVTGNVLAWNGQSWSTPRTIDAGVPFGFTSVSCAPRTTSFCVTVDSSGNVLAWNGESWSAPQPLDPGYGLTSVSCPSASFCTTVDGSGKAFTWNGSSWSAALPVDSHGVNSISCPTSTYCVAVGGFYAMTWDGTSWSAPQSIDRGDLTSISCPNRSFCVAVDSLGSAVTWNGESWSAPVEIDHNNDITSVSCPSSSFCVAVEHFGNALTWNGRSWSAPVSVDPNSYPGFSSVSCPTTSFCAAVDGASNALVAKS